MATLCPNAALFKKVVDVMQCLVHEYIHIQTNWNILGASKYTWGDFSVRSKWILEDTVPTAGERMDKATLCSAGR